MMNYVYDIAEKNLHLKKLLTLVFLVGFQFSISAQPYLSNRNPTTFPYNVGKFSVPNRLFCLDEFYGPIFVLDVFYKSKKRN